MRLFIHIQKSPSLLEYIYYTFFTEKVKLTQTTEMLKMMQTVLLLLSKPNPWQLSIANISGCVQGLQLSIKQKQHVNCCTRMVLWLSAWVYVCCALQHEPYVYVLVLVLISVIWELAIWRFYLKWKEKVLQVTINI